MSIDAIARILSKSESPQESITRDKVREWMRATDIESLGATAALMLNREAVSKITPPLEQEEVAQFLRAYFSRCFSEDPEGDWADSRHSAGWTVARLMLSWTNNDTISDSFLEDWRDWLAEKYRAADENVRLAIETAVLEHVLHDPSMRRLFGSWRGDPTLNGAYERSKGGPS